MTNIPLTPEQSSKRWGSAAKWIGFVIVCTIFGPYAATAVAGALGLAVLLAIWLAYWCFAGYIQDTVANWRLKLLKAAAAANPVETLQNEELRRASLLQEKETQIQNFMGRVRQFDNKLNWYKSEFPSEADKYQSISNQLHQVQTVLQNQYKKGVQAQSAYHKIVTKADADWQMAIAVKDATKDMVSLQEDFMAKLKSTTALDTIDTDFSSAMAQVDTLIMDNADVDSTVAQATPEVKSIQDGDGNTTINLKEHRKKVESDQQ